MDQIEQDFARLRQPAIAIVGGVAAALVVATIPHVYLEKLIGMTGVAEFVSAAAPPLGNTARGLIAALAGLVAASAIYLLLNRKGNPDMSNAIRRNLNVEAPHPEPESESRFSIPKLALSAGALTKFLKKPKKSAGQVTNLRDLPNLRGVDAHPDAPPRAPIFASADLGAPLVDKIKPFEPVATPVAAPAPPPIVEPAPVQAAVQAAAHAPVHPPVAQEPSFASPQAPQAPYVPVLSPAPLDPPEELTRPKVETPVAVRAPVPQPSPAQYSSPVVTEVAAPAAVDQDLSELSIAQLTDRLASSLSRLKQLEASSRGDVMQPVQPVVSTPVASVTSVQQPVASPATVHQPAQQPQAPIAEAAPAPLVTPSSAPASIEGAQAARHANMDAALKAALGTLERVTAQR